MLNHHGTRAIVRVPWCSVSMSTLLGTALLGTLLATRGGGDFRREPLSFFRDQIGLTDQQISSIAGGEVVVKTLPTELPSEVIVFGAVFVKATPEAYVRLAFDVNRLRQSPSYLDVGRISDPPRRSDLDGFTLEPEDVRHLRSCRPGKCGIQLPADAMKAFQTGLDWSAPNPSRELNERLREMALNLVRRYQQDGNKVLGAYRDSDPPFDVEAQIKSLLARSNALPLYLPELNRVLLDYPNFAPANLRSQFSWERVAFGLKPTLRLNHTLAYQSTGPKGSAQVVAVKQLYASHYLQLALDLTACVRPPGEAGKAGFYLISVKGSTQSGLTGWRGSLLRRIIVSRSRSAQEKILLNIKRSLEERP